MLPRSRATSPSGKYVNWASCVLLCLCHLFSVFSLPSIMRHVTFLCLPYSTLHWSTGMSMEIYLCPNHTTGWDHITTWKSSVYLLRSRRSLEPYLPSFFFASASRRTLLIYSLLHCGRIFMPIVFACVAFFPIEALQNTPFFAETLTSWWERRSA